MTVKKVRLAVAKLKEAKILRTRRLAVGKLSAELSYGFVNQKSFISRDEGHLPFRKEHAEQFGFCAAVILFSFQYWIATY